MAVTERNDDFWKNKIRAFLHDPPDKIIKIQNHEKRRNKILGDELKFRKDRGVGKLIFTSDLMASSLQRIDLEKVDGKMLSSTFYKIHGGNYILVGVPVLRHPISGNIREYSLITSTLPNLSTNFGEEEYEEKFNEILGLFLKAEKEAFNELVKLDDPEKSYFTLWRYYPELLKKKVAEKFNKHRESKESCKQLAEEFVNLTAYTLSPDHMLFDHADATSAIYGALIKSEAENASEESRKPALLMFKLSPVQDFIKNARKERDLWAGSHLLSFLIFQAVKVIVDEFGPDAIIFPHLRGQPFFDNSYEKKFEDVPDDLKPESLDDKLKIANIPNRFLAIVGFKKQEIGDIKCKIEKVVRDTILGIFNYCWSDEGAINDRILKKVEDKLKELKGEAEKKGRTNDVEKYEKALEKLGELSKEYYQRLAENYFRITLEVLEVPFELDERGKSKEESYETLENFVKSLNLPKNVEKKYLDWLSMLKSFGAHPANVFDLYALMFEVLEEIVGIESRKFEKVEGESAYKCSLCGGLEAIGGEDYVLMRHLWSVIGDVKPSEIRDAKPFTFKKNEHLCPVCLIKRCYHEWLKNVGKNGKPWNVDAGFESVSKVALKKVITKSEELGVKITFYDIMYNKKCASELDLLEHYNIYWNAIRRILDRFKLKHDEDLFYKENLSSVKSLAKTLGLDEDEIVKYVKNVESLLKTARESIEEIESRVGEFEKYYSILIMDGDNMGKLLIGDEMECVADYLHLEVLKYLPQGAKEKVEKTKRLVTPTTHAAISRALAYFSINKVPEIVEKHRGELIYAGGDDVLALLPVDTTLRCAYDIQNEFNKDWDGWELLPAKTMSAGILIVYYKHPLYDALDKARELEKKAKEMGRNAVAIGYLARSGTYNEVVFNWSIVPKLGKSVELIKNSEKNEEPSLSKRIIYHVTQEIDALPNDENAVREYLKYEFSRHYKGSEEVEHFVDDVISLAKNVRVKVSKEDFADLQDLMVIDKIKKSSLNRVNLEILNLISENNLTCGRLYDKFKTILREYLKENNCDFYERLYGLILKKQIKGLFILLKILVDCDAEFGGESYEDYHRA